MRFRIRIDGEPVSAARPRFRRTKKGVMTHPTKKTHESLVRIKSQATKKMKGREKLTGPLEVRIMAAFPCTKKRIRKRKPAMARFKDTGPDIDNIAKHYLDGLLASGIVANDDNQVVSLAAAKIELGQDAEPYTEIVIEEVFPNDDSNPLAELITAALSKIG
jgi:Holliday junction resolvase RusA-like endonuclease